MALRLLEECTCDLCGIILIYEKARFNHDEPKFYRLEGTEEWLSQHGWTFSDGLRKGDFCPACSQRRKVSK